MAGNTQVEHLLRDRLAAGEPLDEAQVESLLRQLADQVAALHAAGRFHGEIGPGAVEVDEQWRATLTGPSDMVFTVASAANALPPEVHGRAVPPLPTNLDQASVALGAAGLQVDPRRIDIYQIGCLACEFLSGGSVRAYLFSPKAKAKVPAKWRRLIDRLLGCDPAERIGDCAQLIAELSKLVDAPQVRPVDNTPPLGTGIDATTNTPRAPHPVAPPPHAAVPLPFEQLGHYQVTARLGSGGMGDVYLGYEPALERQVALKVLPPELARQPDFVQRFVDEAKAAARLIHPNIVQIYYIGEDQGHNFFAMQFVPGESLAAKLSRECRLSLDGALAIVEQVLAGLAVAHGQGMIHRDIKPGNILLDTAHDRALLADFGLVKSLDSSVQMTATGMVMGTVDYIAPEQGRGQRVDARSDLYSIGVLLYQMLSGQLPFAADSPTAMVFQHAYEKPRPLDDAAPGVPTGVAAVVHRLLAKNPAERYQSAGDLLDDIRALRAAPDFQPQAIFSLPAAGAASQKSVIITAPDFDVADEEHRLTAALVPFPRARWQDRLRALFQLHAPEALKNLQNTQQQVEGALAVYELRREKLAQLAHEAQAVEQSLAAQNLAEQLAEQRAQREEIELSLAKADATLRKLRSQQALLQARLRTAEAGQRILEPSSRARVNWRLIGGLLVTSAALAALSLVLFAMSWLFESPVVPPTPREVAISEPVPLEALTSGEGPWSTPENAGPLINSEANDGGPFIAPGGRTMYFHSMRPGYGRNDLWATERDTIVDDWGTPQNLGPEINGTSWDESPSITADGLLLVFDSDRPGGLGARDIYLAARSTTNRAWSTPTNLGPNINGPSKDFSPFISMDGLTLVFASDRPGGLGGQDLYRSTRRSRIEPWGPAALLPAPINSASNESSPWLSPSGRLMLFSSDRPGGFGQSDLWWALRPNPSSPFGRPFNLGSTINSPAVETNGRFSPDGSELKLWFTSRRPGGRGGYDIWFSHLVLKPLPAPPPGTWQVNFPAGAQRNVTLTELPDARLLLQGTGNLDGVYQWNGRRLTVLDPDDDRFTELAWGWVNDELVLAAEPLNHPAGAKYLGTRLKFISPTTSVERPSNQELEAESIGEP